MLDYGDEHFDDLPKTKYNNEEPLNYDDEDTSRTALNHGDAPDTSNGRIALNYDDDSSNARIALNYDDAPDNSNSRGNLVNYGDVDEVEKDDSESEYEDYEYGKQILPVSSKSNITVPMNGAEYLRTVRDQAKTIPRVVAAEVKKRTFADPDACFGEWRVSLLEMDAFKRPRIESKDEESSIKKEVRNSIESSIKNETDLHSENWPDSALRRFYNIRKGLKRIPYDEIIPKVEKSTLKARSLYQAFILLDEFKLNKNEFQQLYNIYLELNEEERHILLPLVLVFQNANNMESGQA